MHKSALPSAIRNTLNNAVYDVKTNTMPKSAKETFVNRSNNFFKSQSKFDKAEGFNVNTMKATVGFIEGGLKGGNNYAVKDLEQQEYGGRINRKSFIPLKQARVGGSANNMVKSAHRLTNIQKVINARNNSAKSNRQRFVKSAIAAGRGGYVLSGRTLWKINSFKRDGRINKTAVYSFRQGRSVQVKQTKFMEKASIETAFKMENDFKQQAERQILKLK